MATGTRDGDGDRDRDDPSSARSGDGPTSDPRTWVLLDADRRLLAAGICGGLFVSLVAVGALDAVPLRETLASSDPIETLFQGLLTAIVTGVTLVVTINQLVLSQELGAAGDQRERMDGAMAFRREVSAALEAPVAPAEPGPFLGALVGETAARAAELAAAADDAAGAASVERDGGDAAGAVGSGGNAGDGADVRTDVEVEVEVDERVVDYATDLRDVAGDVSRTLTTADFGDFGVVSAALRFDYSRRLHEGRRLRAERALPPAVDEALVAVLDALELYGPAREHLKTLYFQWALIELSRAVLYAAVPALVVATSMVLYASDVPTASWTLLGVDSVVWLASGAATVALAPFAVLLAYVLRIATVAKRTLAIGPFTLEG